MFSKVIFVYEQLHVYVRVLFIFKGICGYYLNNKARNSHKTLFLLVVSVIDSVHANIWSSIETWLTT